MKARSSPSVLNWTLVSSEYFQTFIADLFSEIAGRVANAVGSDETGGDIVVEVACC
jgi:hypothetical protein